MKISILTPTYNRGNLLKKLYDSICEQDSKAQVEWLIMDDGSTDNTNQVVEEFIRENKIVIQYYNQPNSGKMTAINNLVEKASGDLIVECDSDDYFSKGAFEVIEQAYEDTKNREDIYAMCFLKYDLEGKNIGKNFQRKETTMFDLYFKNGEDGEKALVYIASIRKKYTYKLENNEKFGTEARLHHEMDLKYVIRCYNSCIMICEYRKDGYTTNIQKVFKENPYGYLAYFTEIFQHDFSGVIWKKRLYVIKHYILFSVLTNNKNLLNNVQGIFNKLLVILLYIPGKILTKKKFQ